MSQRTKVTTSQGTTREHGAHGITLLMRHIRGPRAVAADPGPSRDRSLRGKARRQARKAARR